MANRRISELNQLLQGDIERTDYLLILDSNEPETKKLSIGDISDYIVGEAGGVTSGSVQELSASLVLISSSVSNIEGQTSSFATVSQLDGKLESALTASFFPLQAFGIPTLSSSGLIYSQFLPNFLSTFNGRAGNVTALYGDYSASMIPFASSSDVPQTNVQTAIDHVSSNRVDIAGDTMTGPLILSGDPSTGLQAATKDYADLSVKKSGDTMTGNLDTVGIIVASDLLYAVSGTSSVGIGTATPTASSKLHVAGRIRIDEIQFSGDESIQTSAGTGVASFNSRTGVVSSEQSDYLGLYVDSFNGRSGSVVAGNSDYDGYYVKTTGSSTIIDGGIVFENGKISFEDAASTSHDTASIKLQRDSLDGRVVNIGVYTNSTSSLNGLIQDGDYSIIVESSQVGLEDAEPDTGTEGIVIGPYTSGSAGIRISRASTTSVGKLISYGEFESNGLTTLSGVVTGSGIFTFVGSTIFDGFTSASVLDVGGATTLRENVYVYGTGGVFAQNGSLYTKNIHLSSPDGIDLDYGKVYASELIITPRSEDSSGNIIIAVPMNVFAPVQSVAPVYVSSSIKVNGAKVSPSYIVISGSYTAESGDNIATNTVSSAISVTMSASPSMGDCIKFIDAHGTWATNNLTVTAGAIPINGSVGDLIFNISGLGFEMIFVDSPTGWRVIQ